MSFFTDLYNIIFPPEPERVSNTVDGTLRGLYASLTYTIHKYGENQYYYIDNEKTRHEIILTGEDNGRIMEFNLPTRKFQVKLFR